MTVRELIQKLQEVDEEVMDYEVEIKSTLVLFGANSSYITVFTRNVQVPENCNVDRGILVLESSSR